MTKTICIYHGNCADGFTAAWCVRLALGYSVEFVPGIYGEEPPDVTGADVIMVDFSYKRPVIDAMCEQARSILILDHHQTAEQELAGLPSPDVDSGQDNWEEHLQAVSEGSYAGLPAALFDMHRSGAQLAWDFFQSVPERPALVDYVADRDLWRFDLPGSRAVAAWLFSHPYDFGIWTELARMVDEERYSVLAQGDAIERKHHKDIAELVKVMRRPMTIGGYRVQVANLPYTLASDAAGMMAEGKPFAACYFDRADGQRVFSLRSREGGVNVADIAAAYGGGGHAAAAGFQMPIGWEGDDEGIGGGDECA